METAEIRAMLKKLPKRPWRVDEVRSDEVTVVGALRASTGHNVIEPSAEAQSMVIGLRPSMEFLPLAPTIIEELLDRIEALEKPQVAPQTQSEVSDA